MKLKPLLLSLGVISVIHAQYTFASNLSFNPKIDKFVQEQFKSKHQPDTVFIILKDKADLSGANKLATREEKGRFVYDTLRNTALVTQAPIVDLLQTRKA